MSAKPLPKPLQGIRVLTLEQFGAGPYGTMFLAELGAEVIKVEAPDGDPSRQVGPHKLGDKDSEYFQAWNLGKKSVTLDIKSAAGRRQFEALVQTADCVVNNLRGSQPAKLGIDYARLKSIKPSIVCLHISAYGRAGERADWPGYDFLMQAEAGLMELTGDPEGAPTRVGVSLIDSMSGLTGTVGLLACLLRAKTTGQGCDVETCLYDVAMHQLTYPGVWYLNEGDVSPRVPRSAHLSLAPVQTFPTKDGWIFIMCMTQKFWLSLVKAMDREELLADSRFPDPNSRAVNRAALTDALDPTFRTRTTAEWLATFNGLLPAAPVHRLDQALDSGFARETGMVSAVPHPVKGSLRVIANPLRIDGERLEQSACSPLGADNATLLGQTHMKLEGLKVVDLSWFLPGPYLTTALADHGAEVIKVEPPDGDPGRHIRPPDQRTSVFFRNMGRGKKSVVLDLKTKEGRADLFRLASAADVLVESFRPGVAARFGVGYEAVKAANPGIVYCSISAFGQDSAYPGRAAHDLALEAMTGVLSLTLGDDGRPAIPGIPVADLVSGLHGLSGVLMALLRRQATGRGDYIDVSMHEALMASCANVMGTAFTDGTPPDVKNQRTTGGSAFYRVYDTSDGRQLVLAGQEMKFIRNLLSALGRPEFIETCEWPGAHQKPVIAFLAATFRGKPLAHWMKWLDTLDICYGPVNTLPEAIADANLVKRGAIVVADDGRKHLAPVVRFRDEPSRPLYREPLLGEHTKEILKR